MEILSNLDSNKFFEEAATIAKQATCQRSKCGAIIVKDKEIIGRGFNSPAKDSESQRRCYLEKSSYDKKVTDKTCCIHAEQRAMFDALKNNTEKLVESELYFIRLDENNNPSFSGKPYCTICSKMALDLGIKNFILLHEEGPTSYDTEEYNKISYEYSND
jgi:deoxycytidylate deaminase